MKTFTLSLFLLAITSGFLFAQQKNRVKVEDKQDMQDALKQRVYRYPSFRTGNAYLPNGNFNTAKFNLNLLTDKIQFIDSQKDTLSILTPELLAYVVIDSTKFIYHNDKVLEVLGEYFPVVLAVNRKIKVADYQRIGAYGSKSSSASIANINTGFTDKLRYEPTVHEDLLVKTDPTFYLVNEKESIVPLNKGTIIKAFPAHQTAIKAFMKQHKINMKDEKDVRKLLNYASGL